MLYRIPVPCADRRHPKWDRSYLEVEEGKIKDNVCQLCGTHWTTDELTEMELFVKAVDSNMKAYEYPAGARGHFTGD